MNQGTAKDVAAVVGSAGEIVGRTRLQKTVALLEMTGLGFGFKFDYYKFGPFSEDLVASLDRAIALEYVSEDEKRASWGGRYSIFKTAERRLTGDPARDELIKLAKDADAVALELAVTAAFLKKEGSSNAWAEVEQRKPEKAEYIEKAKSLYALLSKVKGIKHSLPDLA
jgi:uncharacterized protein YwgA